MLKAFVANLLFGDGGTRSTSYVVSATDELAAKAYFRNHFERETMVIEGISEFPQDAFGNLPEGEVRPVSKRPQNLRARP